MAIYVVLMGGPGAGKGTQAKKLQKQMGLPQISTGDLFRENFKNETKLGRQARPYVDSGELVPDEITLGMVGERLKRPDTEGGAIFDGFPRTIAQADALEALLAENGERVNVVPYIHVDKDLLLRRLAGRWTCPVCGRVYHDLFNPPQKPGVCDVDGAKLYQREDDTMDTQRRRIEVYFEQTAPLLDYYRGKGLLIQIDGEQSIEQVFEDLRKAIEEAR